jgi:hypothetical protein
MNETEYKNPLNPPRIALQAANFSNEVFMVYLLPVTVTKK